MIASTDGAFPIWFPFAFAGLWYFINFMLADRSGWRLLVRKYAADARPEGEVFRRQVYKFGDGPENGVTKIIVSRGGLYLTPFFPFRAGRAPLLIPWRAVTGVVHGQTLWGRDWYNLDVDAVTLIRVGPKAFAAMSGYLPPPTEAAA